MRYVLVPIGVNIALAVLFAAAGVVECDRLLKRHADLRLENALARAPYLWAIIPLSLLLLFSNVAAVVVRNTHPTLYWGLPPWLDYSIMQIQWCVLTGIFAFTFGLTTSFALRTAHRERHMILTASVLFVDHPFAGPESHAVAFLGLEQGRAVVWDPLVGLTRNDASELASFWKGHAVEFVDPERR